MPLDHWEPEAWATVLILLILEHAVRFVPVWPLMDFPCIDTRKWGWLEDATLNRGFYNS
jgi:hypothetical protein